MWVNILEIIYLYMLKLVISIIFLNDVNVWDFLRNNCYGLKW